MEFPHDSVEKVAELAGEPGAGQRILEDIEGRGKLGCGCIGTMLAFLAIVYGAASWWLGGSDFALVLVCVMGLVTYAASFMRGYHFLTGTAWLLMALMGLGLSPTVFGLVHPGASLAALPGWMQQRPVMMGLVAGSLLGLGVLLVQMRKVASTQEAIFAIQIQAAARRTDPEELGDHLSGALNVLRECAELGCWPIAAEYLNVQEHGLMPTDHPARLVLKPLLVVRADEAMGSGDEGWVEFGVQPFLDEPTAWSTTVTKLAPRSVGLLFCDADTLHYDPLRKGVERVSLPLSSISRARMHIHALELEANGEVWTFAGVHLWRVLSLATFLRVFDIDVSKAKSVLWATRVRANNLLAETAVIEAIPSAEALRPRIAAVVGSGEAHRACLEGLIGVGCPTLNALADRLLGIWEATDEGAHERAQEGLSSTSLWLESFPDGDGPVFGLLADAARLLDDIEGAIFVETRNWTELAEFVGGWAPWEGDEPEALSEALSEAVAAIGEGEAVSLDAVKSGWPGSLCLDALCGVVAGGSTD